VNSPLGRFNSTGPRVQIQVLFGLVQISFGPARVMSFYLFLGPRVVSFYRKENIQLVSSFSHENDFLTNNYWKKNNFLIIKFSKYFYNLKWYFLSGLLSSMITSNSKWSFKWFFFIYFNISFHSYSYFPRTQIVKKKWSIWIHTNLFRGQLVFFLLFST